MKKALSLILALAMALSLAACGGGKTETPSDSNTPADNTSAEPTKLSLILRGGTYADVIKECLPAFEAEHNVVCEVQELSEGDLYSGIALDAINDKGSYDLCINTTKRFVKDIVPAIAKFCEDWFNSHG